VKAGSTRRWSSN